MSGGPGGRKVARADRERYRALGVSALRVGSAMELAHAEAGGKPALLPSLDVDVLLKCREFRTLEEHARQFCETEGLGDQRVPMILYQLAQFARSGLLVNARELLEHARAAAGPPPPPAKIGTATIVTKDRPEALARTAGSLAENAGRFGRSIRILVSDDSESDRTYEENRRALEGIGKRTGIGVEIASRKARAAFADRLAREAGVDPALVAFALLGIPNADVTTGANRNTLLLETEGEAFLGLDDDVVCRVARRAEAQEGPVVSTGAVPSEVWFHPDRAAAESAVRFVEEDLLAAHEAVLGRRLAHEVEDLDPVDEHLFRLLRSGSGRVRLSQNGLVGDCAVGTWHWVLSLEGASRQRLLESEEAYALALRSREVVRAVDRRTITASPFLMCYSFGADGRELLPPFVPNGRFQDGLFALVLRKTDEGSCTAHLPELVLHAPPTARPWGKERGKAVGTGVHEAFIACLVPYEAGPSARTPQDRLRAIGGHLRDLAALPAGDLDGYIREVLWQEASRGLLAMEAALEENGSGPGPWKTDVRNAILARREALVRPEFTVPGDLVRAGRSPDDARALVRRWVGDFGTLMECWPDLLRAAAALRKREVRPFERV